MNWRATISLRKALPIWAIPKGIFIRAGFLHIQKIDKYTLGCFGSQVHLVIFIITGYSRTKFGGEHQVELADIRPVTGTTDGAFYIIRFNQCF